MPYDLAANQSDTASVADSLDENLQRPEDAPTSRPGARRRCLASSEASGLNSVEGSAATSRCAAFRRDCELWRLSRVQPSSGNTEIIARSLGASGPRGESGGAGASVMAPGVGFSMASEVAAWSTNNVKRDAPSRMFWVGCR